MFETLVRVFAGALAGYAGIGLTFAFVFVSVGVQRLDPLARGVGFGFRLSILPRGDRILACVFKPWMRVVVEPPPEDTPHRIARAKD